MVEPNHFSEVVRFAGKASTQISHHIKDGVTEEYVRRRVLLAIEKDKVYLPDGSYKLAYLLKRGKPLLYVLRFIATFL